MSEPKRIIISRTDSIGDVVLTLPAAGILKRKFPETDLIFLGRSYTRDVIKACEHIDSFLDWDEIKKLTAEEGIKVLKAAQADIIIHVFPRHEIATLARKAGIPVRMGTTNRLYHWGTCNKLVRLSRRRSELHESQLNIRLIEGITGKLNIGTDKIPGLYGLNRIEPLKEDLLQLIDRNKYNLILHPGSMGSAREWGIDNFIKLIDILPEEEFNIFISGTSADAEALRGSHILEHAKITDITGKMSLGQFLAFISLCDGLIAASTGPLHLAAALGIRAVGIYPPIRPMHPGRWAPVGEKAVFLVKEGTCNECKDGKACRCMQEISPEAVKMKLK